MTNALAIRGLTSHVGKFTLNDVSLELRHGTIMGFVGKNGSGKTTFIKTILDIIPRTKGEVLYNGLSLFDNEIAVKAKIGVVFDSHIYPANLKPRKIKNLMAPFYHSFDHNRFEGLMNRFELDRDKKLAAYSKGMQMKFSIAMALSHDPDLIILDEPTAGLDPAARADLLDLLLELMQNENKSILFSTHITSDLEKVADYLTIIDQGRVILSQGKDELLDRYALVQVDKESMPELGRNLIGARETALGYTGLCPRERISSRSEIKIARPTIEDLLIYFTAGGLSSC